MNRLFDHEKLEVYQASLSFIVWLEPVLERLPRSLAVMDQLDRASTSIPLNIAEGNGKFTSADRCRFFEYEYEYDYDRRRTRDPRQILREECGVLPSLTEALFSCFSISS